MQHPGSETQGLPEEITQLLRRWQGGDDDAKALVIEAVYDQVRAIARRVIRSDPGATITATELAHEALIRLLGAEPSWQDRTHLYHVLAQATRQVLVDAARRRQCDKRGGDVAPESLSAAANVGSNEDQALIRINEAIEQLSRRDARSARIIELTYFAGLERGEIASVLQLSVPTIDRDLRLGRAWLKRALEA
ncbi:MAG: ECF-type sigma factor [Dokdonella sp.]